MMCEHHARIPCKHTAVPAAAYVVYVTLVQRSWFSIAVWTAISLMTYTTTCNLSNALCKHRARHRQQKLLYAPSMS